MTQTPDVKATVIVPLWNHRTFVARQIESLLRQWRSDLELLVIDDGSTDEGFEVAQALLAAHPGIRATLMRNGRTMGATLPNVALRQASGPIIIQADSDDVAMPDRIARILRCFDADPTCQLVTSNALRISVHDAVLGLHDTQFGDAVFTDPIPVAQRVGDVRWLGATAAFRREVFEAFPPIEDDTCAALIDLLTPFRATLLGSHHYLAAPLVGWRQHSANIHRTLGVFASEGPKAERYRFLELTILAQKLRDAQAAQAGRPDRVLGPAIAACNAFFFAMFTEWTRVRMRLDASAAGGLPPNAPYVGAIPPIVTIHADRPEDVASGTPLGRAAALSSGFYPPEPWGVWTGLHAALTLRLGDGATGSLVVRLRRRPGLALQSLHILLVGAEWVGIVLRDEVTDVDLALPSSAEAGRSVTLILSTLEDEARDGGEPSDDLCQRGVGLVRITVRAASSFKPS